METQGTDGDYALPPIDVPARAGKSRRPSARNSKRDREREDTRKAGETLSDLEIELSILQSSYEACLNAGLQALTREQVSTDGQMPVLTIQMLNVAKCPACQSWIIGLKCPVC